MNRWLRRDFLGNGCHTVNALLSNSPVLRRTLRRFAQASVIVLFFYFTLLGGFALSVREYRWRMITLGILGLLWGSWFLSKLLNRADPPDTQLELPLLVMLGTTVLTTAFSTDPRMSAGRLGLNITLAISLYFTLDWMSDEWRAELLVKAIFLTGGIVCIIGLIEVWQWYGGDWISPVSWREAGVTWSLKQTLRIKSVLHSPNSLAYYLILLVGLAFYKLFHATTTGQRGLWSGYLTLVMVTAILTQSRGGLLGVFTTTVTAVTLFLWPRLGSKLATGGVGLRQIVLAGVLLTLGLVLLVPVIMRTDFSTMATLNLRDDFWRGAINIFLAHPLLGAGPGTFPTQYMAYRNLAGHTAIFTHAHNVWLTVAAEYGIVGVLSVGYFFIVLGRMILRYLRYTKPSQWSGAMLAGASILAGQSVHNLVDDFMEFPIFTWFTIFGITLCLLPLRAQHSSLSSKNQRAWLLLVGSGLLVILGGSLWYGRAFAAYDQARLAAQDGDWLQAARLLEKAVELDPAYRFYGQRLALAYGELARTDQQYLPHALAQQKQAYDQSNSYPPDVAYLACLHWQSGQPERAIELMRAAVSMTPLHSGGLHSYHLGQLTFYFNLGYYLESVGEIDLAQQAYAQVLLAFPRLGTSPYWQVNDSRRQMLRASARMAQQLTDNVNLAAEIAFHSGDYLTALELFAAPPASQIEQAKVLLAMGETERASKLLSSGNSQHTVSAYFYQAQILIASGNFAPAEATMRKAIALSPREPSYYYYWGYLAERQENTLLAEENYKRAIAISTAIRTDYANLVGQRQPLPTEQPFCLMVPYPAESLSEPSLALANLRIAQHDPLEAVTVYQNLLRHEPYNLEAQQRLAELLANYPTR
ncbi:MAG: tetratricopeptide repeat protein [Anaerolineales bacterium]|nr:MAG: tetratricopeptide repeat protein [Anaerolineales bacterium]